MKSRFLSFSSMVLLTLMLFACGGGEQSAPRPQQQLHAQFAVGTQASDYNDVVQNIYVAYFGRPADAGGLVFYETQFLAAGAPTDLRSLAQSYNTNPNVRALIDIFSNSQESQDMYAGNTETFVNAIYRNMFNREPEAGGKAFWMERIGSGALTRGNAAISIMSAAASTDIDIINNKTRVASNFTRALDTTAKQQSYSGLAANAVVRTMMNTVGASTDVNAFQSTITTTIASLSSNNNLGTRAVSIVQQRCLSCHAGYRTAEQIRAAASEISVAVATRRMPLGNATGMTEEERTLIVSWFEAGAP